MENILSFHIKKSIYNDPTRFMVSWWGTYSYFNNKKIKINDVELMNNTHVSSR